MREIRYAHLEAPLWIELFENDRIPRDKRRKGYVIFLCHFVRRGYEPFIFDALTFHAIAVFDRNKRHKLVRAAAYARTGKLPDYIFADRANVKAHFFQTSAERCALLICAAKIASLQLLLYRKSYAV